MKTRSWICQNVQFDKYVNSRTDKSSYAINYALGLYTDDTEMVLQFINFCLTQPQTIAVIKAIISNQKVTEELLVRYFREEFNLAVTWLGIPRQGTFLY
jgi:hypothetical protein